MTNVWFFYAGNAGAACRLAANIAQTPLAVQLQFCVGETASLLAPNFAKASRNGKVYYNEEALDVVKNAIREALLTIAQHKFTFSHDVYNEQDASLVHRIRCSAPPIREQFKVIDHFELFTCTLQDHTNGITFNNNEARNTLQLMLEKADADLFSTVQPVPAAPPAAPKATPVMTAPAPAMTAPAPAMAAPAPAMAEVAASGAMAATAPAMAEVVARGAVAATAPAMAEVVAPEAAALVAPEAAAVVAPKTAAVVAPEAAALVAPEAAAVVAQKTAAVVAPKTAAVVAPKTAAVVDPKTAAVVAPESAAAMAPKTAAVVAPAAAAMAPAAAVVAPAAAVVATEVADMPIVYFLATREAMMTVPPLFASNSVRFRMYVAARERAQFLEQLDCLPEKWVSRIAVVFTPDTVPNAVDCVDYWPAGRMYKEATRDDVMKVLLWKPLLQRQ